MRIGVFGGTFDPPHVGHLELARTALEQLQLEEVLFMPANRNPLKNRPDMAAAKHRLAMTSLLIQEEPKMAVSDMEITRGGPSYTVQTLSELHMVQPADYWFLLGADAVRGLSEWKQPHRLLQLCRLGVALRGSTTESQVLARVPEEFRPKLDFIRMPRVDTSSTEVREKAVRGLAMAPSTTDSVIRYIQQNKLYRG